MINISILDIARGIGITQSDELFVRAFAKDDSEIPVLTSFLGKIRGKIWFHIVQNE